MANRTRTGARTFTSPALITLVVISATTLVSCAPQYIRTRPINAGNQRTLTRQAVPGLVPAAAVARQQQFEEPDAVPVSPTAGGGVQPSPAWRTWIQRVRETWPQVSSRISDIFQTLFTNAFTGQSALGAAGGAVSSAKSVTSYLTTRAVAIRITCRA